MTEGLVGHRGAFEVRAEYWSDTEMDSTRKERAAFRSCEM